MRSIGKRNIRLVISETQHAIAEGHEGSLLREVIKDRLPSSLWETWESADSEIDRIINDTIMHS